MVVAFFLCYLHFHDLLSTHGRVEKEAQSDDGKFTKPLIQKVLNRNGPNIFVQTGDATHSSSSKRQVNDYRYEAGPEKSPRHSRTVQMDAPHTHGVAC